MKKLKLHGETAYILATALLSLAVAMVAAADFGISMVVAPAYVLSLYADGLSFGQAEYVVQGILFSLLPALLAGLIPTMRALRINPVRALRQG